ncbi:alpha-amylase family glycosyl hydrolase [Jeotgalibacillus sp. R-1-5s-1]|uniref:alpha-amylase family glycosyl hydrolase n=1 Tax=Jeotgalibacillus sp. R-1-5s-1 TaxID=2555897 RepID=UPI00106CF6FE|nr:alpha-amylase family glycosyl hydrolase [Jeotgalibacillus sp. R-1-5s-1]TFD97618.1 alpha-amlyase [Jeotgalibacillus sp. R-1-5s-1]
MRRVGSALFLITILLFNSVFSGQADAVEKEERKWQDETIYFLMVDRFNNGDTSNDLTVNRQDPRAYHGGDFQGIINELDYIKDMGFTAIWLTPIFENQEMGYHGYWIEDFYETEEHFGTIEEFKQLVDEAHERDIKVILDFVVNHTAPTHEWVDDPEREDWYHPEQPIRDNNDPEQLENGWIYGLPDLNTENQEVRDYLFDAAKWWIEETNIDGYRLDTVKHVPAEFWTEFSQEVKSVKDDFYLIGEVYDTDIRKIAEYADTGIDGFVDFPLAEQMRTVFQNTDQNSSRLFNYWDYNQQFFNDPYLMGTFIDNHDMTRFTRLASENNMFPGTRWEMATAFMYTVPGIPIIYYGSEIALDGGEDPDNRRLMDLNVDEELQEYIGKLGELRQQLPSLTRGTLEVLYNDNGMLVYEREYEDETTVIAINNTSETQSVDLATADYQDSSELRGLLGGDLVRSENDQFRITLDREVAEVYVVAEETGINYWFLAAIAAVWIFFIGLFIYMRKKGKKKESIAS